MKKSLTLIGSPRKNGNTSLMAGMMINKLSGANYKIEKLHLYDYKIKPCVDCRACKKGEQLCVIDDDMKEIYKKVDEADLLIIGTPIYWFGPTAKTKLMLDRFRPYFVNKKLTGKKAVLLLPAGSGKGDCDLTIDMFKRSFEALGVELLGAVTAEAYDAGEVKDDTVVINSLNSLAQKIISRYGRQN